MVGARNWLLGIFLSSFHTHMSTHTHVPILTPSPPPRPPPPPPPPPPHILTLSPFLTHNAHRCVCVDDRGTWSGGTLLC